MFAFAPKRRPDLKPLFLLAILAVGIALGTAGCSKAGRLKRTLASAAAFFERGELDKARVEYLNAMQQDRGNAVAIERLGLIFQEQGATIQAVPYLKTAAGLNPTNLNVRLRLAMSYLAMGERSNAWQEASAVLDRDPQNVRAILLLSDAAYSAQRITDTEKRLGQLAQTTGDGAPLHLARAGLLLRRKELPRAEAEIRQAIALDPKLPQAHAALAQYYLLTPARTNTALIEQALKRAAELAPPRSAEPLRYAQFLAETGNPEAARQHLLALTDRTSDYIPAWNLLARLTLADQKPAEAMKFTDRVLARDPANLDARSLRGDIHLALGKAREAVKELDALDKVYGGRIPELKYQLAMAHLVNTNLAECTANLRRAIAINPNYVQAILLLAELDLRQGNIPVAVDALQAVIKRDPSILRAQMLLADAFRAQGRLEDATAVLRAVRSGNPNDGQAAYLLGLSYREQGKPAEARAAFLESLRLATNALPPVVQLVMLDLEATNYPAATQRVQSLIAQDPKAAVPRWLEGRVFAAQQQWDRAEASLNQAIELNPDFQDAYFELARVYITSQQISKALARTATILEKNPKHTRALMLQGILQSQQGEYAQAASSYEALLQVRTSFIPALNNLAYLYSEHLNQLDRAHGLAQRAHALAPDDPVLADTLGWILYRRGQYPESLAFLRKAAERIPENPEIRYHLGMAYYMVGQADAAKAALQRAVAASGSFPGKEEAQRRLLLLGFEASKPPKAVIADLEALLKQSPDDTLLNLRLADLYAHEAAGDKALPRYETVLRKDPNSVAAHLGLARLFDGPLRDPDKAMTHARKARTLAPKDPEVAHVLGRLTFQTGDHPYALNLLQESARTLTNKTELLHDLGWAYYSVGRVPDAAQSMQLALQLNPPSAQANAARWFLNMIALTSRPQDWAQGESQVKDLLKADPTHVPALMVQAAIQETRGETRAAGEAYEKILVRFPRFAPAQKQLAALYANTLGDEKKAFDLALKARETLSTDPELARTLGKLAYRRSDFAYAARLLQESSRQLPSDAEVFFILGMAQHKLKETSAAKASLQKALSLSPNSPLAAEARKTLQQLGG